MLLSSIHLSSALYPDNIGLPPVDDCCVEIILQWFDAICHHAVIQSSSSLLVVGATDSKAVDAGQRICRRQVLFFDVGIHGNLSSAVLLNEFAFSDESVLVASFH
jgi:hypothetical protein